MHILTLKMVFNGGNNIMRVNNNAQNFFYNVSLRKWAGLTAMLGSAVLAAGPSAALAADVTFERLLNPEPHNWLMVPPIATANCSFIFLMFDLLIWSSVECRCAV